MTRNLDLIPNYGKDNLLNNTGAEYIFIMIDRACFKSDDVVGERAKMSDEILSGLSRRNQGYLMGGATGLRHCYIDFIIFDGKKSIQTIQNVIKEKYPELRGSIRYFANEKRNRIMAF